MATYDPRVLHYSTPVREAHPIAQAVASALGRITGRGINGGSGTVIYGYPADGTRSKYAGYLNPAQMFMGWNPRNVAAGQIVNDASSLPGTSSPVGYATAIQNLLAQTNGGPR